MSLVGFCTSLWVGNRIVDGTTSFERFAEDGFRPGGALRLSCWRTEKPNRRRWKVSIVLLMMILVQVPSSKMQNTGLQRCKTWRNEENKGNKEDSGGGGLLRWCNTPHHEIVKLGAPEETSNAIHNNTFHHKVATTLRRKKYEKRQRTNVGLTCRCNVSPCRETRQPSLYRLRSAEINLRALRLARIVCRQRSTETCDCIRTKTGTPECNANILIQFRILRHVAHLVLA